jgi:hypothetical protein
LADMPKTLHQQLQNGVKINVRWSKSSFKTVSIEDIGSAGLVAVSCPGAGKYGAERTLVAQDWLTAGRTSATHHPMRRWVVSSRRSSPTRPRTA